MKLTCALVDDEPLALELLASYVEKTPFLQLKGKYSSAVMAMKEMADNPTDLLFLDIQMPELNGLEYSKLVNPETRIIFTTAFEQYAIDGYKVNALDYLLKPISYNDFLTAVHKAVKWFELKRDATASSLPSGKTMDFIYVKSEYKLVRIALNDILYIEGLKDYIKIYTETSPRPVLSLMSMKSMEENLPSDRFMRVHRSYIVQKNKIEVVERGRIVFGKNFIPISDNYKQDVQNYLNTHTL